jgi:hypothetical protein
LVTVWLFAKGLVGPSFGAGVTRTPPTFWNQVAGATHSPLAAGATGASVGVAGVAASLPGWHALKAMSVKSSVAFVFMFLP